MADRNIRMKRHNGTDWDSLYPLTATGNVFAEDGKTLDSELSDINNDADNRGINVLKFGAVGDGVKNDQPAIQAAIDYANTSDVRKVIIPPGNYKITSSLSLNGCSVEGLSANVYGGANNGVVLTAATSDFSAVLQGSATASNIEISVKNITVMGAKVGFELTYVINSQFSNLHAIDCETGYLLGKPTSVGSMFNIFENLYTRNCEYGISIDSNEYFSNNIFNNGYIQGRTYALQLKVSGGYGAVNNTFNNVEFRSPDGRGVSLSNTRETGFNKCYFETGGAGVVTATDKINSFSLTGCVFGMFRAANTFGDTSFIVKDDRGGIVSIDGGIVFTTNQLDNCFLYSGGSVNPYRAPYVVTPVSRTGAVSNFNFYSGSYNETLHSNSLNRFVQLRINRFPVGYKTTHRVEEFDVVENSETLTGSQLKLTPGYWQVNTNFATEVSGSFVACYYYLRKNGVNEAAKTYTTPPHSFTADMVMKIEPGDYIEFVLYYDGGGSFEIKGGTTSWVTCKYMGPL